MGCDRAAFVKFAPREDSATLCSGQREPFDYFGGVAKHVLFDNTEAVVVERDAYGPESCLRRAEGSHHRARAPRLRAARREGSQHGRRRQHSG